MTKKKTERIDGEFATDQIRDYNEMRHHAALFYEMLGTETNDPPPEPKEILKWIAHGYTGMDDEEKEAMIALLAIICSHKIMNPAKSSMISELMETIIEAYHETNDMIWTDGISQNMGRLQIRLSTIRDGIRADKID